MKKWDYKLTNQRAIQKSSSVSSLLINFVQALHPQYVIASCITSVQFQKLNLVRVGKYFKFLRVGLGLGLRPVRRVALLVLL